MIKSKATKFTDLIIAFICLLVALICVLPMVNIAARSLSGGEFLMRKEVFLVPKGTNVIAYQTILRDSAFTRSLWWTALITVLGVLLSLVMTTMTAFPLIYDKLKGRGFFNTFIIFTMYFGAGTIPMYLLLKDVGLLNTWPVLIIPYCLSIFNTIIMRSFFYGIPDSMRESAEIDGAGPIRVLVSIYIPLSTSVIATLALFYAVGRWNSYTDALYFLDMTQKKYFPIQLLLYNLTRGLQSLDPTDMPDVIGIGETAKMASVMFATIPILLVYPWLQRYFVAGVTLGSEKG
ncbi:MAG: carbohydrate ABC transporter permease [Oscillospiraceae bacterium]|jgi:putative aldouronate transport system permease protein|nr:carbohydrate ABC transporter permease [Oscillospiraceae bacterium]